MSTSARPIVDHEPVEDVTPVRVYAESLSSTAPEHLLACKRELAADGLAPAAVVLEARFEEDCSLSTQAEADRVREYVRATSFLGAGRLTVRVESVADPAATESALAACAERAEREGVHLEVEGPPSLE